MAYKVGFVGSGGISNRYARIFSEHDELELISCCDVVKDKANILADHYNMNPYTNYQEMINKEHLDIVYIGVPPVVHSEVVSYAINKKLNIICEKPIAHTIDVGKKMTKEAKSSNVVTCINLMIVYSNHVQKIKKMYKNYEFGSLRRVELVLRFPIWPREWQNVSWLKTSEQGGPLREVGTHFFASLKEIFGPVKRVIAIVDYDDPDLYERSAWGIIEFENNVKVSLDLLCNTNHVEENTLSLHGSKKSISFVGWRKLIENYRTHSEKSIDETSHWPNLADEFVKALKGESAKLVSFASATETQEVLSAILSSNGKWIEIN
ncbi:MAG: putative oxidoreductase YcjS [Candidatus Heimdallarchaeota archaeon LC_3]|nr:MAG: putative oxidoreductase YcjS [Candidatus Heimdallarchaeota archaeon LC_3]